MKRTIPLLIVLAVITSVWATAPAAQAEDRITYISQPEQVAIFLNDIAYVRDTVTFPSATQVEIVLPPGVFRDTLVLQENGARVPLYRLNQSSGQTILQWESGADTELREVTLEYLLPGLTWKPVYDMTLSNDVEAETVQFNFFAEISNNALVLDNVEVLLIAGRVATFGQVSTVSTVTTNQVIAGYENAGIPSTSGLGTGPVTIQHVYEVGQMSAAVADTVYTSLAESTLPARRLIIWNSPSDLEASVIYKVRNESDLPLAEGIVRTYRDGLFIGSDFVEVTPIGSEGSITVGTLPDVRVSRTESSTFVDSPRDRFDMKHEVTLTLSNFGSSDVEIEVVDNWPANSADFVFSSEPTRESGNLFRWQVNIASGETITITYQYRAEY